MDPLKLTAEQLAFLKDAYPETPCVGPDGTAAGYWVEAEQFRALRRMAYVELERARERRPEPPPLSPETERIMEGLDTSGSPADVIGRMLDRWDAAGFWPDRAAAELPAEPGDGHAGEGRDGRRKAA